MEGRFPSIEKGNKMSKRIDFYDEVRVVRDIEGYPELRGKTGVVMGISEEDGILYGYGVSFDDLSHGYSFSADEVEPTGRKFKREDFYDGSSISVTADGKLLPPE